MTQQEIQERNQQIALMLSWERHNHGSYFTWTKQNSKDHFYESILQFHSDWNWLISASKLICDTIGYKMYFVSTPSYSRCIFTDTSSIDTGMMPLDKTEFINGKIVVDSDIQKTDIKAVFIAVSDFAKLYNDRKL